MAVTGPGRAGAPDGGAAWLLGCECGYVARAADEDGLVADALRHARDAHRLELSPAQILRGAQRTAPGGEAG